MTPDEQQSIRRAADDLHALARDLERPATPGDDRAAYERRIAAHLRALAQLLDLLATTP